MNIKEIGEKLRSKKFYKKNWHRFIVGPILFFGICFSTGWYQIMGGFHLISWLSLLIGLIFSIIFAKNYNKRHFLILILIILIQIGTVNLNTEKYETFCTNQTLGMFSTNGIHNILINKSRDNKEIYSKINCDCIGLKRNYWDSEYCVGKAANCYIEDFYKGNNESIEKINFPCEDYLDIKEKKRNFYDPDDMANRYYQSELKE